MAYAASAGRHRYVFDDLRALLARASPDRSGDRLAGLAADTEEERVAARMALADAPLSRFLDEPVVAGETDEVIRFPADHFGWTGLGHQWKFVPVRRSWLSSSMQRWAMTASRSASVAK